MHELYKTRNEQIEDNAFAACEKPFFPHVFLDFEGSQYVLLIYSDDPANGEEIGKLPLDLLLTSDARFVVEGSKNGTGRICAGDVLILNRELEERALWLERLAAEIRRSKASAALDGDGR